MARWGLGKWVASWVTPVLARVEKTFDAVWSRVHDMGLGVNQSFVADQYRAAQKIDYNTINLANVPLGEKVSIPSMVETELARPRRYMVVFDVTTYDNDTDKFSVERRRVYFNARMSPDDYRAEYLGDVMNRSATSDKTILDASYVTVLHNSQYKTY